jgi:transglutaminase-like putative cysteine protease
VSIHVALNHLTHYRYDRPISLAPQVVRLRPAPHSRTPILSYSLKVTPAQHFINWQQDPQANYLARLVSPRRRANLRRSRSGGRDVGDQPLRLLPRALRRDLSFQVRGLAAEELEPYLHRLAADPAAAEFLATIPRRRAPASTFWSISTSGCSTRSATSSASSPACRRPEETLTLALGSCRDSAWLLVQVLRNLGLAARFVSGYLIQLVPDVKVTRRAFRHRS